MDTFLIYSWYSVVTFAVYLDRSGDSDSGVSDSVWQGNPHAVHHSSRAHAPACPHSILHLTLSDYANFRAYPLRSGDKRKTNANHILSKQRVEIS